MLPVVPVLPLYIYDVHVEELVRCLTDNCIIVDYRVFDLFLGSAKLCGKPKLGREGLVWQARRGRPIQAEDEEQGQTRRALLLDALTRLPLITLQQPYEQTCLKNTVNNS